LSAAQQIKDACWLAQVSPLGLDCNYAAQHLGADLEALLRFVRVWDKQICSCDRLLRQLQGLWEERLVDAMAVQEVLQSSDGHCLVREQLAHQLPQSTLDRRRAPFCQPSVLS